MGTDSAFCLAGTNACQTGNPWQAIVGKPRAVTWRDMQAFRRAPIIQKKRATASQKLISYIVTFAKKRPKTPILLGFPADQKSKKN